MKDLIQKEVQKFNFYLGLHSPFTTNNFVFCLLTFTNLSLQDFKSMRSIHSGIPSKKEILKDLDTLIDLHDKEKFTFEFLNGIIKNPKFVRLKIIPFLENKRRVPSFVLGDKGLTFLFERLNFIEHNSIDYLRFLFVLVNLFGEDEILPFLFYRPDVLKKFDDWKKVSGLVTAEDLGIDLNSLGKVNFDDPKIQEFIKDTVRKQEEIKEQGRKTPTYEEWHTEINPHKPIKS